MKSTLTSLGLAWSLAACSGHSESGSCEMALQRAGDSVLNTISNAPLGGYLDLSVEGVGIRRCTVQIEPSQANGRWRLGLTLSQHCYEYDSSLIQSSSLNVFVAPDVAEQLEMQQGSGFIKDLPVGLERVLRRQNVESALQNTSVPEALQKEIVTQYFTASEWTETENIMATCSPVADQSNALEHVKTEVFKRPGFQTLCFDTFDFDYQVGWLEASEVTEQLSNVLSLYEQPVNPSTSSLTGVAETVGKFSEALRRESQKDYDRAAIEFADFMISGCNEKYTFEKIQAHYKESEDLFSFLRMNRLEKLMPLWEKMCPYKQQIGQAVGEFVTVNGRLAIDVLRDLNYTGPFDGFPTLMYAETLPSSPPLSSVIEDLRAEYSDKLKDYVSLTAHFQDEAGKSSFSALAVNEVELSESAPGRVIFLIPEDKAFPLFRETDSGSVLTAGGVFPIGVLSTVDGERVSGGASVVPLDAAGSTQTANTSPVGASDVAQNGSARRNAAQPSEPGSPSAAPAVEVRDTNRRNVSLDPVAVSSESSSADTTVVASVEPSSSTTVGSGSARTPGRADARRRTPRLPSSGSAACL